MNSSAAFSIGSLNTAEICRVHLIFVVLMLLPTLGAIMGTKWLVKPDKMLHTDFQSNFIIYKRSETKLYKT